MKAKLFLISLLMGTSALAANVPVYNSIFMAAGSVNGDRYENIKKLMQAMREHTTYDKVERLALTLSVAVVNTDEKTVQYSFFDVVDRTDRIQCTFNLVFKVKPGERNEAQLLDVKANENCQRDD